MLIPQAIVQQGASGGLSEFYSATLGADSASIDTGANGIPQTATHLWCIALLRSDEAANISVVTRLRFNNDSGGANYGTERMYASDTTGGIASKDAGSGIIPHITGANAPANMFGIVEFIVPFYTGSTKIKNVRGTTALERDTFFGTGADIAIFHGIWNDTSAISRLAFTTNVGNFVAGSTVTVYGI